MPTRHELGGGGVHELAEERVDAFRVDLEGQDPPAEGLQGELGGGGERVSVSSGTQTGGASGEDVA
jgi:hypothetical protein